MQIRKLPLVGYIYAAFTLIVISAGTIAATYNNLPPVIPLFFGRPGGSGQLIATAGLFIAPGAALIITLMNTVLAVYLKDDFLKKIMAVSSFFISLLAMITVVKIILLVGFW